MLAQEKNIKGFNVLEVIVVLAIVGLISAVAYPKITHWNAQRQVYSAASKIKTLFTNINAQVQRGLYGFVQIYVKKNKDSLEQINYVFIDSLLQYVNYKYVWLEGDSILFKNFVRNFCSF